MIVKPISRTKFAIPGRVPRESLQEIFDGIYSQDLREKLDIYLASYYDEETHETVICLFPCKVVFATATISSSSKIIDIGKKGGTRQVEICSISFDPQFFPMPTCDVMKAIWLGDIRRKRFLKHLTFVTHGDSTISTWQIVADEKNLPLIEEASFMLLESFGYNVDNDDNMPKKIAVLDEVKNRLVTVIKKLG